jgi:NifU-like protein involved in Fe-S cluster formation
MGAYSERVRRLFADPAHAGDLPPGYARTCAAEVRESDAGCRVVLAAAADDAGMLNAVRYRAFGCPHLIAAAEAFCADVEGRPAEALRELSAPALMATLCVPVEKTGRILLLQDAADALARKLLDGTNEART